MGWRDRLIHALGWFPGPQPDTSPERLSASVASGRLDSDAALEKAGYTYEWYVDEMREKAVEEIKAAEEYAQFMMGQVGVDPLMGMSGEQWIVAGRPMQGFDEAIRVAAEAKEAERKPGVV